MSNLANDQVTTAVLLAAGTGSRPLSIEYVVNPRDWTTNNLDSLWLARTEIHEAFLLVESDVAFDDGRWYEVDTLEDLRKAELMFPTEIFG